MPIQVNSMVGQDSIILETGNWAKQADGSIVYRCANLVLLATVCATDESKEGQDFFPLTVEYLEKMYAIGKFPGGYFKRESKPSEHEILISRLIDRPIRPMFPDGYFCDVQILVQVLSSEKNISIAGHAINAASAALMVSDIPFSGPLSGVRIGRFEGRLVHNPPADKMDQSDLDMVMAGNKDYVVNHGGEGKEHTNQESMDGLKLVHGNI